MLQDDREALCRVRRQPAEGLLPDRRGPWPLADILDALRCNNSVLCEVTAQSIDRLGLLSLAGLKKHRLALLLRAFGRDKAHCRARRRLGDRFRVRRVILLPLDEGLTY